MIYPLVATPNFILKMKDNDEYINKSRQIIIPIFLQLDEHLMKPFTKEEIRKIRKALENRKDGARDLALFNVQVDTMLRTSDLRNLTVHDVQSSETGEIKEQISVTMKKTGNTVACVLDQASKESSHQWITTSGKSSQDYLFTGKKGSS